MTVSVKLVVTHHACQGIIRVFPNAEQSLVEDSERPTCHRLVTGSLIYSSDREMI